MINSTEDLGSSPKDDKTIDFITPIGLDAFLLLFRTVVLATAKLFHLFSEL